MKIRLRAESGVRVLGGEFGFAARLREKLDEPRLVKRDGTAIESRDLTRVGIGTRNLVPQKSETNARGQADITGSKNCNVHKSLSYDGEHPGEMEP